MSICAVDTSVLLLLLDDSAKIPADPATKQPIPRSRERVRHWIQSAHREGIQIIVSTPVVCESFIRSDDGIRAGLTVLKGHTAVRIHAFDESAAIELAEVSRTAWRRSAKAKGEPAYQKVKIDRQIIATAKAHGAESICTMDSDIRKAAKEFSLRCFGIGDLPEPPAEQIPLALVEIAGLTS